MRRPVGVVQALLRTIRFASVVYDEASSDLRGVYLAACTEFGADFRARASKLEAVCAFCLASLKAISRINRIYQRLLPSCRRAAYLHQEKIHADVGSFTGPSAISVNRTA
jgi:hypothetical protein